MDNDTLKEVVLDWVNAVRLNFSHKPITDIEKGEMSNAYSCPIANSVPEIELINSDHYHHSRKKWFTPKVVSEFLNRFDRGEYPEYLIVEEKKSAPNLFSSEKVKDYARYIISILEAHTNADAADKCNICLDSINDKAKKIVELTTR